MLSLSTVHYNLKALSKAGIIDDSTFHYSQKGKEVIHYSLKNKAIILLPRGEQSSSSLKQKLKTIQPGILTTAGIIIAGAFFGTNSIKSGAPAQDAKTYAAESTSSGASAQDAAMHTAESVSKTTPPEPSFLSQLFNSPEFLIGLGCALVIIILSIVSYTLLKRARQH